MARVDLRQAPYYDDYESTKQYYQLLAIPGRNAQAREFTQMQSVLRNIIRSVGDSILRNGDIVEGCQVLVNSSKTAVTVTEGKIYIEGIVLPVKESTVTITGSGIEQIGAKLMEVIVDENTDSTLKDPAQGYDNYNQAGCSRLKIWIDITVNDPDSATIATLVDGSVLVENNVPDYDILTQTLARRTYDESGSYIVEGLKVRLEEKDNQNYNVVVEPGKAYILGYELKIPTARRITVPKATDYSAVSAANYVYDKDVSSYLIDSDPFVKEILSVNGRVSTTENQTTPTNVDRVLLDQLNVVRITEVKQGSKTYTVGATSGSGDCSLVRDGTRYYLQWNGTENYPSPGVSYAVSYEYTTDFINGTDYELTLVNSSHYLTWKTGANHPLDETNFIINYNQYLARKDVVYIDRYGMIDVALGEYAEYGYETTKDVPLNTLALAVISNPPNGSVIASPSSLAIEVSNIGLTRFTMNDIQRILTRLQTVEYDQAVLTLNDDARQVATTNDKKGILTDPLADLSRLDYYFNRDTSGTTLDETKPIFDMAVDLTSNICYLPVVSNTTSPTLNEESSTYNQYKRLISLATTGESIVLNQPRATKSFLVNPYSVYPQLPEVVIDPATDSWFDDTIITIPVSLNATEIVKTSTRNVSVGWGNTSRTTSTTTDTAIGVRTETTTNTVLLQEEAVKYIRQRTITVEGKDFAPNLDNIKCYFDSQLVTLTPAEGTSAGALPGTVKANNKGYVKATFTIPANVLTGAREVSLKSDIIIDNYQNEGYTLYLATGTARTFQRTVTTIQTVLMERTVTNTTTRWYVNYDPVGQSFTLSEMTILKGINLYFENKSDTASVSCEIRGVTNGVINSTVYAHKVLAASEVNVSANSLTATRFNFDDPVVLEANVEYAFVVRSVSDDYRIWVAEIGENDVASKELVLNNPYLAGVMFSSSNNTSWTTHQTTDIKFQLITDNYQTTNTIVYDDISVTDAARLYLMADAAVFSGTSITWYYAVDGSTNFKAITPQEMTLLNNTVSSVSLKATLRRDTNSKLSPLLAIDTVTLIDSHYDLSGCYISRNVAGLDAYTTVTVVMDTYVPSGCSLNVKVSRDDGENLVAATAVGNGKTLNYGWKEMTYQATVASSTQCRIFVEATSTNKFLTPAIRRIRAIMS